MKFPISFSKFKDFYSFKQKKELKFFFFLSFAGMILETLSIGLILPFLSLLSENEINYNFQKYLEIFSISHFTQIELINLAILLLIIIFTIKTLFLTFISYKQIKFLIRLKIEISEKLFTIYLKRPYNFHLQNNSAQLIRNLNDSKEIVVVTKAVLILFTEIIVLLGLLTLLLLYEPAGTIFTSTILGLVGFIFYKKAQIKATKWGKERMFHEGLRMQHLQQGFGSIKEIKVLGRENTFINFFSSHNKLSNLAQFKENFLMSLPRLWFEWLTVLGMVLLVFVLMSYEKDLSILVPTLGLFAAVAFRLVPSIVRIMNSFQQILFGYPVAEAYSKEFNIEKNDSNKTESIKNDLISFKEKIELNKINFTYPNTTNKILSEINLKILQGSSIGIIGDSGAGKTTLLNILLGLLHPNSGEVLVDGKNISNGIRSWQNLIGYVPQNVYLSDDTLKKNIALGIFEELIDNNKIEDCLKSSKLQGFISQLNNGVNTKAGEFGDRISGGQRQRIGIARALYHNPAILILDEYTNALDIETEKKIVCEVNLLKGKKTIIMISHRLSALSNCDKIYKITKKGILGHEIQK